MQKTNTIVNTRDLLKGQKIVAAIYLVTNHLSDTDPIKMSLRTEAIAILLANPGDRIIIAGRVDDLLGAAKIAQIISEKNVSIISNEIKNFSHANSEEILSGIFDHQPEELRTNKHHLPYTHEKMSLKGSVSKSEDQFANKNKRQSQILSFINDRKAVAIKDIAKLFPDISEKTIQRELGLLVEQGKISKRGSKRWSVYMAVVSS